MSTHILSSDHFDWALGLANVMFSVYGPVNSSPSIIELKERNNLQNKSSLSFPDTNTDPYSKFKTEKYMNPTVLFLSLQNPCVTYST
jgi:hypothetical protein